MILSYADQELITRIILGCGKLVSKMEDKWYDRRTGKDSKTSQRERIQLSVLYPSLTEHYAKGGFRPFPEVRSRLSGIETPNSGLVYDSLKTLVNVNYFQKRTDMGHSHFSAVNTKYHESDYVESLKELVSKGIPRTIIWCKLLESGILERYLTICSYTQLSRNKYTDIEEFLKARKVIGKLEVEQDIDSIRKEYLANQKLLKDKTNKKILLVAQKLAEMDIQNKPLDDPIYIRFFIAGGISYGEIQN